MKAVAASMTNGIQHGTEMETSDNSGAKIVKVITVVGRNTVWGRKEFRRHNGIRLKFEDNSCVIVKDLKGNPKGTVIKGPVAKEVCDRWPAIAKLASIVV